MAINGEILIVKCVKGDFLSFSRLGVPIGEDPSVEKVALIIGQAVAVPDKFEARSSRKTSIQEILKVDCGFSEET